MTELHELSALEQWEAMQRGELAPVELTAHYLERIERIDPDVHAFHEVTAEAALARARAVQEGVPASAPLWGMPFADKDLVRRRGVRTTFGSRVFADHIPDYSDPMALALDAAGGISLGKTATPEFGMPSHTENLVAPPTRNPWNLELSPGGSSGGAAAAVAARLLPFAPGSDGGGSIRIPAAACGLVGVKPTRGLVPAMSGVGTLGGLVVGGPIARSVADAAFLLDGMIHRRPDGTIAHPFTLRAPDSGPFLGAAIRGEGRFQIGVMTTSPWEREHPIEVSAEAMSALDLAIDELSDLEHGLDAVAPDWGSEYARAFRTLWQVGAAGIPVDPSGLHLLEPLTRWLHRSGSTIRGAQLAEALAALAEVERSLIAQLSGFDAVLTPALALPPRPLGWYDAEDPEHNFAQQVLYTPFTSFVNVAGLPAIVVPVSRENGLPMGVQLVGRPGGEATLFAIARQLERRFRQDRVDPCAAS